MSPPPAVSLQLSKEELQAANKGIENASFKIAKKQAQRAKVQQLAKKQQKTLATLSRA